LAECEGSVGALAEAKSAGEEQVQQQAKEQKTGHTQQRKEAVQVVRCTREEAELSQAIQASSETVLGQFKQAVQVFLLAEQRLNLLG
jgi:hypothetical protein